MPGENYRKNISILVLFASSKLCAASALANEDSPVGKDKFKLSIGAFLPAIDSELKVNSKAIGGGTVI